MSSKKRISSIKLGKAKSKCCKEEALPEDWEDWFPSTISLLLDRADSELTVKDLENFVAIRLSHKDDPYRYLEAAQVLALLYYLGSPESDVVVIPY